jgi:hypothetical protein
MGIDNTLSFGYKISHVSGLVRSRNYGGVGVVKKPEVPKYIKVKIVVVPLILSLFVLFIIVLGSSGLWILISTYSWKDYFSVTQKVLKNLGGFSALLAGLIATVLFQSFNQIREHEKEHYELQKVKEESISDVGHFCLAFSREDDTYEEKFNGSKVVVLIEDENDYSLGFRIDSKDTSRYRHSPFQAKFLSSQPNSPILKNIMAFNDEYFNQNKKGIIKNYYDYCDKLECSAPLYCSAKYVREVDNSKIDINRYFHLFIPIDNIPSYYVKNMWVTAVTESGTLLLLKIKYSLSYEYNKEQERDGTRFRLLQQTTYFRYNEQILPLHY